MVQITKKFNVRLTEKPVITIAAEGKPSVTKDWGRFILGKKYLVYALYDDGQHPTGFLLADEDRAFFWISMGICRRA